jgi:hypothetical protein
MTKLAARARMLDTGHGRKTDAHGVQGDGPLRVVVVLAKMTPDSEGTYFRLEEPVAPDSLGFDQVLSKIINETAERLPNAVADFLTYASRHGVPRRA